METTVKRGRGRGRGTRARGRGRGRGRKAVVDEEICEQTPMDTNGVAAVDDSVAADVVPPTPMVDTGVAVAAGDDVVMTHDLNKENEMTDGDNTASTSTPTLSETIAQQQPPLLVQEEQRPVQPIPVLPPTIDMEADISQLEAPTFTTISRGPPEPMLRLKWDHKVSLMGEKVLNPMIHCCDQCDKPILLYGRMIPCKHVFCLKCARTEPVKICPRCNDKVLRVEQSGLGMVFMCTHGGSRYGNTGCRRTYLSQRDLQAHINHRHVTQMLSSTNDLKPEAVIETHKPLGLSQRKISESSVSTTIQAPSSLLTTRPQPLRVPSSIGSIPPPGSSNSSGVSNSLGIGSSGGSGGGGGGGSGSHSSLTAANLARINNANATDCHQGKVALHQTLKKTPITQSLHQNPDSVADASYYSSVLNSFGGGASGGPGGANTQNSSSMGGGGGSGMANPNSAASVGYTYDPSNNGGGGSGGGVGQAGGMGGGQQAAQSVWQQNQYYR